MAKASRKYRDQRIYGQERVSPVTLKGGDGELVLAGMVARCFKVDPMSISRWRQIFGLPHLRVRSDMVGEGGLFVYDLDEAEKWAKSCGRSFQRKLAFDVKLPRKMKSVRRIPREDRDSA